MDISIIIPNYNGVALLRENIPLLLHEVFSKQYEKYSIEVVIIDDHSEDASISLLKDIIAEKKVKEKVKIIQNEKNLGFPLSINNAVKQSRGRLILLLNTDVVPQKGFLHSLVEHFKKEEIFAVGCMDKSIEKETVVLRGRGIGIWKRGFLIHARGETDKSITLWVSGGSGMFRKSLWDTLGGFCPLYSPFYWEDIDLSYRALKSGYSLVFEPNSVVIHAHEKGAIQTNYSKSKIKTIAYRNQFIFVWINATDFFLQAAHLLWLPYHFLKAMLHLDWEFFMGFWQALFQIPSILQTSFKYQKSFAKSDKQVTQQFKQEMNTI